MKKQTWLKVGILIFVVAAILALDLATKYCLDANLEYGKEYSIIPRLFNFQITYNFGAAWGILSGKQVFLIVLSLVFLAIFIFYYVKEKNKTWLLTIAFAFLIGGCIGNLFDRIFIGYVRDFIQFDFWKSFPVFNFADVFLCFGVVLFVIYLIVYFVKNNTKKAISIEMPQETAEKTQNNSEKTQKEENLKKNQDQDITFKSGRNDAAKLEQKGKKAKKSKKSGQKRLENINEADND